MGERKGEEVSFDYAPKIASEIKDVSFHPSSLAKHLKLRRLEIMKESSSCFKMLQTEKSMKNNYRRAWSLSDIAIAPANACDLEGAIRMSGEIHESGVRSRRFRNIAIEFSTASQAGICTAALNFYEILGAIPSKS